MECEGEKTHEVELLEIEFNAGVIPWFFNMASTADMPDPNFPTGPKKSLNRPKNAQNGINSEILGVSAIDFSAPSASFIELNPDFIPDPLEDLKEE